MTEAQMWHLIFDEFKHCLTALGARFNDKDLHEPVDLVHEAMDNTHRYFHRVAHVFDLIDAKDSILTLAALYHDVIYYQVDEAFPPRAEKTMNALVRLEGKDMYVTDDALKKRPDLAMVFHLFEVHPGQKLNPLRGLNEFLSAVVAHDALKPYLSPNLLAQIFVCIEATIPFRPVQNSIDPSALLEKKLRTCNRQFGLKLSENEVIDAVKRAVDLANRDVKNFASTDHSWFLATTWLLLPERNERLRGTQYTFKDYRSSLQKMKEFFSFLTPEVVFRHYRGFPDHIAFEKQKAAAARNIQLARTYLRAKITAIAMLEALADLSGGDLPINEFLGKVRPRGATSKRMEDFLPTPLSLAPTDAAVLRLLQNGRALETTFDLQNSPLASFVYQQLNDAQFDSLWKNCLHYFAGQISAEEYLREFSPTILLPVIAACKKSCPKRGKALSELNFHAAKKVAKG